MRFKRFLKTDKDGAEMTAAARSFHKRGAANRASRGISATAEPLVVLYARLIRWVH